MTQTASLQDKAVLITGGARRVGAHVARLLHQQGMRIAIHYRSSEHEALMLAEELERARAGSVALMQADLLDTAALPTLIDEAVVRFGRIDVLINNASSFYPTPVQSATEADWEDLIGTNLRAPFFLSRAAASYLKMVGGCIVNMIDIHAQRPLKNYPIYSAAKAGLAMLTRSLARELAPEVRVNGVAPGTILWPEAGLDPAVQQEILARTPQKRAGSPDDVARAILFLVRDADYITGQVIAVDGGRSIVM